MRKNWILFAVMAGVGGESLLMALLYYFQWRSWQPMLVYSENPYGWQLAISIIIAVVTLIIAAFQLSSALRMRRHRAEYLKQHPELPKPAQPVEEQMPKLFNRDNSELVARYIHTKRRQALCVAIIAGVVEAVIGVLLAVGDVLEILNNTSLVDYSLLPVVAGLLLFVEAPLCFVARYMGKDANWRWLTVIATILAWESLGIGLLFGLVALI